MGKTHCKHSNNGKVLLCLLVALLRLASHHDLYEENGFDTFYLRAQGTAEQATPWRQPAQLEPAMPSA